MIKRIESVDNGKLRAVRKLHQKKYRDSEGRFIIEGINLIREAVAKGVHMDTLVIADGFDAGDIVEAAIRGGTEVLSVPRNVFERLSDSVNGSGMIGVVRKPGYTLESLEQTILPTDNIVVLDRLQDPGNIGTIVRTAVAAGYGAVIAIKGTADIFSPKVLRATAGMIFDIPIIYLDSADIMFDVVRRLDKRICVTVPVNGEPYYSVNLREGIALVIGNEGNGISDHIISNADELITIPMSGDIESLNAAVSAGILMYEAMRQSN